MKKRDDLDAYTLRSERLATGQQRALAQWATALSVCLTGNAQSVSSRLSPEDSINYEKVKRAPQRRKQEKGETSTQYTMRLGNLFKRWLEMAEFRKDYKGVHNLILTEQFMKGCQPKLVLFVWESKTEKLDDFAELADCYLEAQN